MAGTSPAMTVWEAHAMATSVARIKRSEIRDSFARVTIRPGRRSASSGLLASYAGMTRVSMLRCSVERSHGKSVQAGSSHGLPVTIGEDGAARLLSGNDEIIRCRGAGPRVQSTRDTCAVSPAAPARRQPRLLRSTTQAPPAAMSLLQSVSSGARLSSAMRMMVRVVEPIPGSRACNTIGSRSPISEA